ncbi:uncharacterized protein DNG_03941 [Cephalotrichum gorgonifer]|uniref:Uncharacterized protein n=1 Tax=Cephalotrichum gorgonifer TaxID=2041049 RepID=A0AAE8MX82_9PEZI|nr:uncharacterized protein DNG_03941 [Cephalotrichum gorgonifer]
MRTGSWIPGNGDKDGQTGSIDTPAAEPPEDLPQSISTSLPSTEAQDTPIVPGAGEQPGWLGSQSPLIGPDDREVSTTSARNSQRETFIHPDPQVGDLENRPRGTRRAPAKRRRRLPATPQALANPFREFVLTDRWAVMNQRGKLAQCSVDDAIYLFRRSENIMVITGASISTSAGLPDFRSSTGLFSKLPEELFSLKTFENDPTVFYQEAKDILVPETEGSSRADEEDANAEKEDPSPEDKANDPASPCGGL